MKLHSAVSSFASRERANYIDLREKIAVWCLSLLLITINIIRILRVPITHDEPPDQRDVLLTYWDYIHLSKVTANIHILNSIIRKFFIDTFGNTPFFLRLDNLLAQILFLACSYGIVVKLFKDKWWRICCFLLLNLNPFLFEFWGFSRGYGLAIALMTASIYCFVCYLQHGKTRWLAGSLALSVGAVYSNFSLLNFMLGLAGFIVVYGLFLRKKPVSFFLRRELPLLAATGIITYLLIAGPIRKLVAAGELYFGGEKGLVPDTFHSLVTGSMYLDSEPFRLVDYITWLVAAMIVLMAIYWFLVFLKKHKREKSVNGLLFCCLLLVPLASVELQHQLLGTKYLINRTALFLYVLFVLAVVATLYQFRRHTISLLVLLLFTGLSAYNFSKNITLSRSWMWWVDNYNLVVLDRILKEKEGAGKKISLRVNWEFMPSLNYYIYTRYPDYIDTLVYTHEDPTMADTTYDFMYMKGNDDVLNISPVYEVDTVFETGFQLLRKKK